MDTQYHQPVLELVQVVLLPGRRSRKFTENAPKGRRSGAQEERIHENAPKGRKSGAWEERIHEKRPEEKKKWGVGEENP